MSGVNVTSVRQLSSAINQGKSKFSRSKTGYKKKSRKGKVEPRDVQLSQPNIELVQKANTIKAVLKKSDNTASETRMQEGTKKPEVEQTEEEPKVD